MRRRCRHSSTTTHGFKQCAPPAITSTCSTTSTHCSPPTRSFRERRSRRFELGGGGGRCSSPRRADPPRANGHHHDVHVVARRLVRAPAAEASDVRHRSRAATAAVARASGADEPRCVPPRNRLLPPPPPRLPQPPQYPLPP